jgi:lactoylglutathione lyase
MTIEHVAIWAKNLENLKDFYVQFFKGKANSKYINSSNSFESYFLTFDKGARLELMQKSTICDNTNVIEKQYQGIIHLAFSLGSREKVDILTKELADYGCRILKAPRITGDGYYESELLDPEGNRIELTI